MRGVNKIILLGNVGQDPEVKYMPSGTAVANFSLATNEKWKDKETGEDRERTEWHRCCAFGKTAEIIGQYVGKGKPLYVEGQNRTRKYEGKDGVERYITEVVVREVQLLGGDGGSGGGSAKAQSQAAAYPEAQQATPAGGEDFDDDIPF